MEEEQIVLSIEENATELSHKRQKDEEKRANSKIAVPKSQSSSTEEKCAAIAQEHTNKKIHLREKDGRIELNKRCLKSLTKNLKAQNDKAQSHVKEAIAFQQCKSTG